MELEELVMTHGTRAEPRRLGCHQSSHSRGSSPRGGQSHELQRLCGFSFLSPFRGTVCEGALSLFYRHNKGTFN